MLWGVRPVGRAPTLQTRDGRGAHVAARRARRYEAIRAAALPEALVRLTTYQGPRSEVPSSAFQVVPGVAGPDNFAPLRSALPSLSGTTTDR